MSVIKLGPLETVTSLAVTTSLGDVVEKEDYQSTSICSLASSLATSLMDKPNVQMNITQQYLDSLSDSQLAEFSEKLFEKKDELTFMTINFNEPEETEEKEHTR